MSFAQPTPASDVKIADYVAHLILFYPRSIRTGIVTTNGIADAIVADVVILTHPEGPKAESNVLIFQKMLQSTLKGSIGADPVLGRLTRGTAKPGQSAPYILAPYDQADGTFATQYLTSVSGNPFPSFQPPAAAPAPVPQAVAPVPVPVAAAPAPVPVAVAPAPVPQAVAPVAPVALPQAPGVPAAPPQWAAPQAAAPVAVAPMPVATIDPANAAAAMQALGMQVPPIAPQ